MMTEKKHTRNINCMTKLRRKKFYKWKKNEIRNKENEDWNWKVRKKEDSDVHYLSWDRTEEEKN